MPQLGKFIIFIALLACLVHMLPSALVYCAICCRAIAVIKRENINTQQQQQSMTVTEAAVNSCGNVQPCQIVNLPPRVAAAANVSQTLLSVEHV